MRTRSVLPLLLLLAALAPPARAQDLPEVRPATADAILAELARREARVVVVNFWATWCVPCREEFPGFVRLGKVFEQDGVDVVFVSADFEEELPEARRFLAEHGVTAPSYLKTGKDDAFVTAFSSDWTGALPATALYGPGAKLLAFWEGKVAFDELQARVRAYLQ